MQDWDFLVQLLHGNLGPPGSPVLPLSSPPIPSPPQDSIHPSPPISPSLACAPAFEVSPNPPRSQPCLPPLAPVPPPCSPSMPMHVPVSLLLWDPLTSCPSPSPPPGMALTPSPEGAMEMFPPACHGNLGTECTADRAGSGSPVLCQPARAATLREAAAQYCESQAGVGEVPQTVGFAYIKATDKGPAIYLSAYVRDEPAQGHCPALI